MNRIVSWAKWAAPSKSLLLHCGLDRLKIWVHRVHIHGQTHLVQVTFPLNPFIRAYDKFL
jgi:hypothetical protein